ncbi:NifU family protein [Mycolicibacterium baixiangningiae]|uniref:NifU family protein n=1 Tax=Mycolicibacterium baixiangningiae TaxID=2761578 RepID=UPI0018D0BFE2|nr:NifU family protein [Mycolicibacterium baixiangningiae]
MSPPSDQDARWATAGERIQTLLDASPAGGAAARERAEQLVGEVTDLYGAALARLLRLTLTAEPSLAEAVAADPLVASLLLVHGLHPHSVERRITDALDTVRPYLGSHGGDVHLLDVDGATVRLRFSGSCRSCPSSAVTLELAVEDAVRAAAPEIDTIDVVAAEAPSTVIPAESLLVRVHGPARWLPVPAVDELAPGEVGGFVVAGTVVLACRLGDVVYAYRDRCPSCGRSLAGAHLDGVDLGCPGCGAEFDVVAAGAGVGVPQRLDPVPVLNRAGVWSMAIAEGAA